MLTNESVEGLNYEQAEGDGSRRGVDVQKVVYAAEQELRRLLEEKRQIAKRIRIIQVTVAGLVVLFGADILSEDFSRALGVKNGRRTPGITEACRLVLSREPNAMTAGEVCESVRKEYSHLLLHHKSPLASVATVLTRLSRQGKIRFLLKDGRKTWEYIP